MLGWLIYFMFLVSYVMTKTSTLWPYDFIYPKISGIRSVLIYLSDDLCYYYTFSGSIDSKKFSKNMMIEGAYTVTFSSTFYYPSDRSYYGMVSSKDSDDNNVVIVFGGIGTDSVYGDFWSYRIDTDTWNKLELELPEPLYDFAYTSIYDPIAKKTTIYIVGGINNINVFVEATYKCVIEDNKCEKINNYVDCTGFPLAGAELIYNDGLLYLFFGHYLNEDLGYSSFDYFLKLCTLDLNDESQWIISSLKNWDNDYGLSHGGSCLYDNKIFYFFGSVIDYYGIWYEDQIYTLDLSTLEWNTVDFECPDDFNCAIDSFSIVCDNHYATISGGKSYYGSVNSIITILMDSLELLYKSDIDYPPPRAFSAFTQSSTKLILFGGINRGDLFNEVWEYEFISLDELGYWRLLPILGSAPEPRYGHAAATQGIFTFYVGGKTYEDRILSDIWLLNTVSNTWTEYIPSGTQIPPVTRTCAMLDLPKLYFIGGLDYAGSNFDLWEYDVSTNILVQLRKTKDTDIGIFGHACQLIKKYGEVFIYTFYGMTNTQNDLYCSINKINITDTNHITITTNSDRYDFACRGNFGYSFDGETMVFVGGEIYPDFIMNDIWFIEFQDSYEEYYFVDYDDDVLVFYEKLSGSSVVAFSDYIFVFSGYYNGTFSINSDLSSSIYAIPYTGRQFCSQGFYKESECQPCQIGTYSPLGSEKCMPCPLGTVGNFTAASHVSQCIPCALGSFYNETIKGCEECPEDLLCPVGAQEPLDPNTAIIKEQTTQPPNFHQRSKGYSLYFVLGAFIFTFIAFTIFFFLSDLIRILLSIGSFFNNSHLEIIDEESHQNVRKNNIVYGGYLTGVVIIIYFFYIVFSCVNYYYENEEETQGLIPLVTLTQDYKFINNSMKIEVYMYSYRGGCNEIPIQDSDFFNIDHINIEENIVGNNTVLCTHTIEVTFEELFTTEAYAELNFLSYTSDIAITVTTDSGNPNDISSVTQILSSTDGDVLIGNEPNVFTIKIIPALYVREYYLINAKESLGFRLVSTELPAKGSTKSIENIHLATGFKVKARFVLSEFAVITYRQIQKNIISLILDLLSAGPGVVGALKFFLVYSEKAYYKLKKIETGTELGVLDEYRRIKNQIKVKSSDGE